MKKLCLMTALVVTLTLALASPSFSDISLGLSVYKPNIKLTVGQQTTFAVGRIYNTGTNTIYVTSKISQGFPLTIQDPNVTLAAGDSAEINVYASNITEELVGTYRGKVEVTGHSLEPVSGNPVVPGGTLPFNITVIRGLPATFKVFELNMQPFEVSNSETVNASVSIANTGDEEGVYPIVLKLDGVVYAEQNVTIAAGMNVTVTLPVSAEVGQHVLSVENLNASFTVNSPQSFGDPAMIVLAAASLAAVACVGVFIYKRKRGVETKSKSGDV